MKSILDVAMEAAREAGDYILASVTGISELEIEQKTLHDYVSEVDRESEKMIRAKVLDCFPDHSFVGEEFGITESSTSDSIKWIVDPLDGTTNFIRGIPHFAVSVGVEIHGELQYAVVFDPSKDEMFQASKGQGSFLNGVRLMVDNSRPFTGALLATGIPFSGKVLSEIDCFTATFNQLLAQQTSGIRRLGSAALDLAYVAAGRYDGFWEARLQPWDIAAGALLVTEAGGLVTDFNGGDAFLESGDIIAASDGVFPVLLDATQQNYRRNYQANTQRK